MVNYRTAQFSCNTFWGYKTMIDLDECENIEEVINLAKNKLKEFLVSHNLQKLVEILNDKNYHIHDLTFENLLLIEPKYNDSDFYICSH